MLTTTAFAAPRKRLAEFRGLDFPFALRVCRQVSTPSALHCVRRGLARDYPNAFAS